MQRKVKAVSIILTLATIAISYHWYGQNTKVVEAYNADNLIRFHVIANSDTRADQALKLKVRDRVVQSMTPSFSQARDVADARQIVRKNLGRIEKVARAEIIREGKNYPVSVSLGNYNFPTKTYGDLTLPAGKYEAVRVVIGQGKGANWWCVLFPPLCFVDLSADEDGELRVKEPDSLAAKQQSEPEVKVKFKAVEVFQDSVTELARVIGKHLAYKQQETK